MSTRTQEINRLMSQLGHNPHSYNPLIYQCLYQWARSAINVLHGHKHVTINGKTQGTIFSLYVSTKPYCSQHCNQSRVSISTNVSEVYMLQVKVNRCNYNSYVIIYIKWLRQSCYILQHSWNRRNQDVRHYIYGISHNQAYHATYLFDA